MRVTVLPDSGLIVDLPRDRTGLLENGAPRFGVGKGVLRLAFIEETLAQCIHRNAEGIIVAALRVAATVRMLRRFKIGRFSVDWRHMAALPLAGRCCSEREQMIKDFAGVVF